MIHALYSGRINGVVRQLPRNGWLTLPQNKRTINDRVRNQTTDSAPKKPGFFSPERIIAENKPKTFRRYMILPAVATHLCLGSVFSWSIMNDLLRCELGVVVSSAGDWTLSSVVPVFSTILAIHGISAALFGKWQEQVGPRLSGILGAITFGGGLMLGGIGVLLHQLPLLYLGYGVLGGLGMGLAYVPPVATLIRWFPDKRGLATGLTIMGFGGGALVATPITTYLVRVFHKAPQYLGSIDHVELITQQGRQYALVGDSLIEVVVATTTDVASSPTAGLVEGVYLVGTGSTGGAVTLLSLGALYFVIMMGSALSYRTPPDNYVPPGWTPPKVTMTGFVISRNVHIDTVMYTPQFWQIWIAFMCLSSAGMAVVSVAKTMMVEIFAKALPLIVTGTFTSYYIMMISGANLSGRLLWSWASDSLGRKTVFTIFFLSSIPLFLIIPSLAQWTTTTHSEVYLGLFCVSTLFIYSMFGAGYATTPAYEADLYGPKYCGAIHGRMLTASAMASVLGPMIITTLRSVAERNAIYELVSKVDPQVFSQRFGASLDHLDILITAKTVTINKLMQLVPVGTVDPTAFLYNSTMYTAAGILVVGAIANFTIKPVDLKYMMPEEVKHVVKLMTPVIPKFTYGVCVDGSEHGAAALNYILRTMNKETERLLIITADYPHVVAMNQPHWPDLPEEAHTEKRRLLMKCAQLASSYGTDFEILLLVAPNIGEAICFAVKYKNISQLILGQGTRKGIRAVRGISKYCADNADCNVLFVKQSHSSPDPNTPPPVMQIHADSVQLGEWERTREEITPDDITPISVYEIKKDEEVEEKAKVTKS